MKDSLLLKSGFETGRLRDYGSLFSGQTCEAVLRTRSVSPIQRVFHQYDSELGTNVSVWDYLRYVYSVLEQEYRNEYVFKNTFLNTMLLDHYALDTTVAFNEFRVGDAIADLVLMNGISKAFEIKSELDSDARLIGQLSEYQQVFDECYIVIPKSQYKHYSSKVDKSVGIILFEMKNGEYTMTQRRKAKRNKTVDVDTLMRTVRCDEYKAMVRASYGELPQVSAFDMYEACRDKLKCLSSRKLHNLFLETVKKRKTLTQLLPTVPKETRQMYLSLSMNKAQLGVLSNLYDTILSV